MTYTGTCIWFNPKRGYGFIKPDDNAQDVFVHWEHILSEGFKELKTDEKVEYELGTNSNGVCATNIKKL